MKDLSSKQDQILEFLRSFIEDKDYPPSIRDIQEGCGISSTSVVDYNLRKLEEKGLIRRDREVSRGIEVLGSRGSRRARIVEIPILGSIAAGQPIPVPTSERWGNDNEDTVAVTEDMVRGKSNVFALRVKGTSMIEDLIARAEVIDVSKLSGDKVKFGATVVLVDEDTEEERTYQIVGDQEADVKAGRISISSPIARALIGKEVGEAIEVNAPGGARGYEIVEVRFG